MGMAHSALGAWMMVGVTFFFLLTIPFRHNGSNLDEKIPPMMRDPLERYITRLIVATLGNSLPAAILFTVLVLVISALMISFHRFSRFLVAVLGRHHQNPKHAAVVR